MEIIYTLLIGISSGVICAICVWLLRPIPKIKICKEIAIEETQFGSKEYRFKIINVSRRMAYDFVIYVRLIFNGDYYTLRCPDIPLLYSRNQFKKMKENKNNKCGINLYNYEHLIPIDVMEIREKKIIKTGNDEIIKKYGEKKLILDDFKECDENLSIEVILIAIDSVSKASVCMCEKLGEMYMGKYEPGNDKITLTNASPIDLTPTS